MWCFPASTDSPPHTAAPVPGKTPLRSARSVQAAAVPRLGLCFVDCFGSSTKLPPASRHSPKNPMLLRRMLTITRLEMEVTPAPADLGTTALTVRSERRKAQYVAIGFAGSGARGERKGSGSRSRTSGPLRQFGRVQQSTRWAYSDIFHGCALAIHAERSSCFNGIQRSRRRKLK